MTFGSTSQYVYAYGLTLRSGVGATTTLNTSAQFNGILESSVLECASTGASCRVALAPTNYKWAINCSFKFANTSQGVNLGSARIVGGSIASGSSAVTEFIKSGGNGSLIDGFDFSNADAALNISAVSNYVLVVRNCKLPASWTGAPVGTPSVGQEVRLYNCDNGDTNYNLWIRTYYGDIVDETTLVRSGGASDGATSISWKMTSGADVEFPNQPLYSDAIVRWNETTGSAITVTVEILHDSATNLKDDEIWLEVMYLGTSGVPLGSFVDDAKADVLATAADQASSSASWTTTGMSNPNKQKLSMTFTPQEKGFIHATVKLAKPSYTVYVCPKLDVS